MNGFEFAKAVTHLLDRQLFTSIFGELLEPYRERLQAREITGAEVREAVMAMFCAGYPARRAQQLSAPYVGLLHERVNPDEACEVLQLLMLLFNLDDAQQAEGVSIEGLPALMDLPEARRFALNTTNCFLAFLAGEPLPTYEERQAEQIRQLAQSVSRSHAAENWGSLMCDPGNVLVAATYLNSFPEAEREKALERAAEHLHNVFHAEDDRIRSESVEGADAAQAADAIWNGMCAGLRQFCAENVHRPSEDAAEV